jgi:hypothetical protein
MERVLFWGNIEQGTRIFATIPRTARIVFGDADTVVASRPVNIGETAVFIKRGEVGHTRV